MIRRDRLSDQVAHDIERKILTGRIGVGDGLPSERDLMVQYGVGRPAVREALLILDKKGFIAIHSGERARVTEPDPKDLLDYLSGAAQMMVRRPEGMQLFQKTRLFTGIALAREAARVATDKALAWLEKLLCADQEAAQAGDLQAFALTDNEFRYGIASLTLNPLVTALYDSVLSVLQDQRHTSLQHPSALAAATACHTRIFEAIANKEPRSGRSRNAPPPIRCRNL